MSNMAKNQIEIGIAKNPDNKKRQFYIGIENDKFGLEYYMGKRELKSFIKELEYYYEENKI